MQSSRQNPTQQCTGRDSQPASFSLAAMPVIFRGIYSQPATTNISIMGWLWADRARAAALRRRLTDLTAAKPDTGSLGLYAVTSRFLSFTCEG